MGWAGRWVWGGESQWQHFWRVISSAMIHFKCQRFHKTASSQEVLIFFSPSSPPAFSGPTSSSPLKFLFRRLTQVRRRIYSKHRLITEQSPITKTQPAHPRTSKKTNKNKKRGRRLSSHSNGAAYLRGVSSEIKLLFLWDKTHNPGQTSTHGRDHEVTLTERSSKQ